VSTYPLSLGLHSTTDIVQAVNDLNARLAALEVFGVSPPNAKDQWAAASAAQVQRLVGRIIFCFGNHTSKTFNSEIEAHEYLEYLWDEDDQKSLICLEMVMIEQRGCDTIFIHRDGGSLSRFVIEIQKAFFDPPNAKDQRADR
jgi:hypothetical protein